MAERALRGTRLGATSYENDRNTDLAPRQEIAFDCPKGHHFTVPFAAEAEVPATWECRVCGTIAFTAAGDQPSPKKTKPPRSHWDMLRERRSIADLEQVLAERLRRLSVRCAQIPVGVATGSFLRTAHAAGLQVHVWTVNDRKTMTDLLDLGVAGIMTDETAILRDVLDARGQWHARPAG